MQNIEIDKRVLNTINLLKDNGYDAYIVGGFVRDICLGAKPKDFDIATNATPDQIKSIFKFRCRIIGKRFKLAHIVYKNYIIEVATFRRDAKDANSSKISQNGMLLRDNNYGSLEEDVLRRDFTVNALYYDPISNTVIDFFNGLEDLKLKQLVLIRKPSVSYKEDPVRMLRAIRFMAKLDFSISESDRLSILKYGYLLKDISRARIFEEILKFFHYGNGVKSYTLLAQYNILPILLPMLKRQDKAQFNSIEKIHLLSLSFADKRFKSGKSLNSAFIFSVFYWYGFEQSYSFFKSKGTLDDTECFNRAASPVLSEVAKIFSMSKFNTEVIREIWNLQNLLISKSSNDLKEALRSYRFRAAYDLLILRSLNEGNKYSTEILFWKEMQRLTNREQNIIFEKIANSNMV
ncbi:MAG: polynucleotide adenylyltransferase PcnB [Psittacicella sp.]